MLYEKGLPLQILTCLEEDDEDVSITQLAKDLHAKRGTVSSAVKTLVLLKQVKTERRQEGKRRSTYVILNANRPRIGRGKDQQEKPVEERMKAWPQAWQDDVQQTWQKYGKGRYTYSRIAIDLLQQEYRAMWQVVLQWMDAGHLCTGDCPPCGMKQYCYELKVTPPEVQTRTPAVVRPWAHSQV